MAGALDVLVLCADPVDGTHSLNLTQELAHFEKALRDAKLPLRLQRVFPPTLKQLQREFAQAKVQGLNPTVFHSPCGDSRRFRGAAITTTIRP